MEEYLITARSVTQAQRMAQLLERRGVRAVVGRVPMGLTGKGCGYVLRLRGQTRTVAALRLLREAGHDAAKAGDGGTGYVPCGGGASLAGAGELSGHAGGGGNRPAMPHTGSKAVWRD